MNKRADVQSMTGFASLELEASAARLRCDVRSVNNRGLDQRIRLPVGLEALEPEVRAQIAARFQRGSIQLTISRDTGDKGSGGFAVDADVFRALAHQATSLAIEMGLAPPTSDGILQIRGVVIATDIDGADVDEEERVVVIAAIEQALDGLAAMRLAEGHAVAGVILAQIAEIERLTAEAAADEARQPAALLKRLQKQVGELLEASRSAGLDRERLEAEAALLATRADIREELDRLEVHVAAVRDLLSGGGPVGRKLEFLAQEFNREANTLCSKSPSSSITAIGLELKATIDQLREQAANLQ